MHSEQPAGMASGLTFSASIYFPPSRIVPKSGVWLLNREVMPVRQKMLKKDSGIVIKKRGII